MLAPIIKGVVVDERSGYDALSPSFNVIICRVVMLDASVCEVVLLFFIYTAMLVCNS